MNPGLLNVGLIDPTPLHRIAATLDGEAAVTIVPRVSWKQLLEAQVKLPENQRLDLVYAPEPAACLAFANAGFNLLCEPPVATSGDEAEELARAVKVSGSVAGVAHVPTGYPMVRRAMEIMREKKIGVVHRVLILVHQSSQSLAQGALRNSGAAAESLMQAVSGLKIRSLCASIASNPFDKGTEHVNIMLQLDRPAKGSMWLTQMNTGEERIEFSLLGDGGSLSWRSDECNDLWYTPKDMAARRLRRGGPEAGPISSEATRFSSLHPEGAAEALANIYRGLYEAIRAKREGRARKGLGREFPTVQDAVRTARFIDAAIESDRAGSTWVEL